MLSSAARAQVNIDQTFSGAWFDPSRQGQGFLIDIDPAAQFMFIAWFTYESNVGKIGGSGQRWLTAQGTYSGGQAELSVFSSSGGAFEERRSVDTQQVGSLTVAFSSCRNGNLDFDLGSDGAGSIPIERLLAGTASLCDTGPPPPATATAPIFQATGGPETGFVSNAHRHDNGDLFVASPRTGRVYRSNNDGVTWERLAIKAGGPFASDGQGGLYAANGCDSDCDSGFGILRSNDGGNSFQRTGLGDETVLGLFADGPLLLAGTVDRNGAASIQRSQNNGSTFSRVVRGDDLPTDFLSNFVRNPATGSIFATAFEFFGSGQLLRAPADGTVFTPVQNTQGGSFGALAAGSRTLAATSDGSIFALDDSGILRSSDDGETWERADNGIPEDVGGGKSVKSLAVADNDVLAVIVSSGQIFESRDRGNSWSDISAPVAEFSADSIVYAADGFLVATTEVRGILQSDTPGEWFFTNSGLVEGETNELLVAPNQRVIAVTDGTPFSSSDGGQSWQRILPPNGFSRGEFAVGPNNEIYAGGNFDPLVFVSNDFGESWTQFREPWPRSGISVEDLAVAPDGQLYVAISDTFDLDSQQGIYRSRDGVNWQLVTGLPNESETVQAPRVRRLEISPTGTLAAQVFVDNPSGSPIFRSLDGGESWVDTGFPSDRSVRDFHFGADDTLYAATSDGLFRLGGDSWVALGTHDDHLRSVTTGPDGTIYAAAELGGVLQSSDNGETFASIGAGLLDGDAEVTALAVVNNRLLAGLESDAIYRSSAVVPATPFRLNQGLSAAFFNPAILGEGFLFDFDPSTNFAFVAWFTFESTGNAGKVGASEQRWLTAQGNYSASGAELVLFKTTGGSFDGQISPTTTAIGSLSFQFTDCQNLRLSYDIEDGDFFSETLNETRLLAGGAGLCEALRGVR